MYEIMTVPFNRRMRGPVPYDPFREMDDFFRAPMHCPTAHISTDIIDRGDRFELSAELPGFSREDIQLRVENGRLTLSAEHKTEDKEEKAEYVRHERYYGSYSRSFSLKGIDKDGIEAAYADGVLTVQLPKLAEEAPDARTIEIR